MKRHTHRYTLAFTKTGQYFGKMCMECDKVIQTTSLTLGDLMDFFDQTSDMGGKVLGESAISDNLVLKGPPEEALGRPAISANDVLKVWEWAKSYVSK